MCIVCFYFGCDLIFGVVYVYVVVGCIDLFVDLFGVFVIGVWLCKLYVCKLYWIVGGECFVLC